LQEISTNALLFSEEPWTRLATLCRRICVLRAQGLTAAADQLHASDFAPALAALRNQAGQIDLFDDERVRLLQAIEQERVANAMLMAELIQSLVNSADGIASTGAATPAATPAALSTPVPFAPANPVRRAPPPESLSIADLLDDMLTQSQHSEA